MKSLMFSVVSFMILVAFSVMGCNAIQSIMEYQKVVEKDNKFIEEFEKAMNDAQGIADQDAWVKQVQEKGIPPIKKSYETLKEVKLPDPEMQKVHDILIEARKELIDAMEKVCKDKDITAYTQTLNKITTKEKDYQTKMGEYYTKYGLTTK